MCSAVRQQYAPTRVAVRGIRRQSHDAISFTGSARCTRPAHSPSTDSAGRLQPTGFANHGAGRGESGRGPAASIIVRTPKRRCDFSADRSNEQPHQPAVGTFPRANKCNRRLPGICEAAQRRCFLKFRPHALSQEPAGLPRVVADHDHQSADGAPRCCSPEGDASCHPAGAHALPGIASTSLVGVGVVAMDELQRSPSSPASDGRFACASERAAIGVPSWAVRPAEKACQKSRPPGCRRRRLQPRHRFCFPIG